jgi:two-component system sensor histidine kinase PilS (NtrC family)
MFAPLMPGSDRGTVVFIEDTNVVYQQAQRLKQVSLGKLSAGIVREIKEPMQGIYTIARAMSQSSIVGGDKFHQPIKDHSMHIERIINNVQNLSNTKATQFEKQNLGMWVAATVKKLEHTTLNNVRIELKVSKTPMEAYFDHSQIRQALNSILENAAFYAKEKNADFAAVHILVGRNKGSKQNIIEIQDNGYGVGIDDLDHIFEPFYSSEGSRSGLGLYLAKQFCEMNMSRLDYVAAQEGARFRITFPTIDQVERQLEKREEFDIRDKGRSAPAA